MTGLAVLLVLVAAVMHAAWNAVVKRAHDPLVMQAFIIAVSAVLALPAALALPPPPAKTWGDILAGVTLHGCYFLLLVRAYRLGDFSHVYPVARGTGPLIVAVVATVFLGESLSAVQLAGVALVSLGIMSLALTARRRRRTEFLVIRPAEEPGGVAGLHAARQTCYHRDRNLEDRTA